MIDTPTHGRVRVRRWLPKRGSDIDDKAWESVQILHELHALYVARSHVHGVGLLASRDFAKHEIAFEFRYDKLRMAWQSLDLLREHFTTRHVSHIVGMWARNATHIYLPNFDDRDLRRVTFLVHYMNHHTEPNLAYDHVTGIYYTLKPVKAGEEVLIDYRTYCPECYAWNIEGHESTATPTNDKSDEGGLTDSDTDL
eukprot:TRINITY_DN3108_c1_g1_i1.p1 TRINITY_DN3108_c1_g1~~TRINITY_DN3108_c1_g1_i1.p1  ORF type:complete len:222 (+),score=51.18 TRINITY_DN3108_c1_g1_i1:78-668(+)